jgi:hypothetical protein
MPVYCVDATTCAGLPGEVHLSAQNTAGSVRLFSDGNRYVYLQGVASTALGDAVVWSGLGSTLRTITTTLGPLAIATAAMAANQWGWYGYSGLFTVNVATSIALADTTPFATATPGALDDAVIAAAKVWGALFRSGGASAALLQIFPSGAWISPDT